MIISINDIHAGIFNIVTNPINYFLIHYPIHHKKLKILLLLQHPHQPEKLIFGH